MSDDGKDNVVDLSERFAVERARRLRRARGPSLLEQSEGKLHPIHAEIQDLLDQILDRAEIYEKAGRPDEAERLRAAVTEVIDDFLLRRSKAHRLRERRRSGRVTLCNPFATARSNRTMTRFQRSLQIWTLLVCAARDRRTYTYGELADALGMGGAGVMAQFLGPIMYYCLQQQLPPLTVLVVNQDTGLPGEGLTTLENVNLDRQRVFTHDWFQMEPPETGDFERAAAA